MTRSTPEGAAAQPAQTDPWASRRGWYAVARSSQLDRSPQRFSLLGNPYVLYRDAGGAVVAHLDRCPHRNVPLSRGRCRDDNTLECPYHGWRFAPDGSCVAIPGRDRDPKPTHRVETFATREQYGLVWVFPDADTGPDGLQPLSVPEASDTSYTTVVREFDYPGSLPDVIENALDVPHTSILHRGLFRSGHEGRHVDVIVRRYRTWAEAEFVGEAPPRGVVGRLLTLGTPSTLEDVRLEHWDRFLLPAVLQVEYRIGGSSHFLITGFCCPQDRNNTRVFAVVCLRTPLPQTVERSLVRVAEPLALKVVAQDVSILKAQTATVAHFGGKRFMSTEIDILGSSINRLLRESREQESCALGSSQSGSRDEPFEEKQIKLRV